MASLNCELISCERSWVRTAIPIKLEFYLLEYINIVSGTCCTWGTIILIGGKYIKCIGWDANDERSWKANLLSENRDFEFCKYNAITYVCVLVLSCKPKGGYNINKKTSVLLPYLHFILSSELYNSQKVPKRNVCYNQ